MKHRNTKKYKSRKFRGSKKRVISKKMTNKKRYGGIVNPFISQSPYAFTNKVDCSNMNVDSIKNMEELHSRYQKCCPKNMLGYKNSSPICKKMEQNFNNLWTTENNSRGHYGYDDTPSSTL